MIIVFVNPDKILRDSFLQTFQQTNKVYSFTEMFDAYKWIKRNEVPPNLIITEVDLLDPSGLQSLKFLETKSKLKDTKLIAFTPEQVEKEQISLVVSEGADAVFSKPTLFNEVSSYIKYLESPGTVSKAKSKKLSGNK
ncbi:hypothetical protein LBMAG27_20630 [Bacteroidota bacterium]|nr:hypothetical protein LBMAG27_20630 [Bacteroidota bacterium]